MDDRYCNNNLHISLWGFDWISVYKSAYICFFVLHVCFSTILVMYIWGGMCVVCLHLCIGKMYMNACVKAVNSQGISEMYLDPRETNQLLKNRYGGGK